MTTHTDRRRSSVPLAAFVAAAAAALALALGGGHAAEGHGDAHAEAAKQGTSAKQLALHDGMRFLWEEHIAWTRLFIVSASHDLPDLPATTDRLLLNQKHIGNAIKPYYGRAAGNELTKLLREHITVAGDLLGAAKAGDQDAVERHSAAWYRNGNEIADFLHEANPRNWQRGEMRKMMRDHLDLTLSEAVAHLGNDNRADIRAYNRIHVQILHMADMLTDGIVAQFPQRFR
jgi:hypothetical protein